MQHTLTAQEKYTLVKIQEDKINPANSSDLKTLFVQLDMNNTTNYILDMQDVRYIDSSGLSAVLVGNRLSHEKNGTLVLTGVNENVAKIIRISQLDRVLEILPTVEEAIDLIFMNDLEKNLLSEDEEE